MARLLGLLDNIEKGVWYTDLEFLNFFFNYMLYKYNSNKEVKKLILEARALVKQKENKAKSEPKEKRVIMQAHSPDKEDNVKPMTRKEENDRVQVRDFFRRKLSNE